MNEACNSTFLWPKLTTPQGVSSGSYLFSIDKHFVNSSLITKILFEKRKRKVFEILEHFRYVFLFRAKYTDRIYESSKASKVCVLLWPKKYFQPVPPCQVYSGWTNIQLHGTVYASSESRLVIHKLFLAF